MGKRNSINKLVISFVAWLFIGVFVVSLVESKKELEKPGYLSDVNSYQMRHIGSESSVFDVLDKTIKEDLGFSLWFNNLSDELKRGFILYIRSAALSSLLGNKIGFNEEDWTAGRSGETARLTLAFLERNDIDDIVSGYKDLFRTAEEQRSLFLENNEWLFLYLKENYDDFEKGLFFFFAEHILSDGFVLNKSHQFSSLQKVITAVSEAIISDRGGNSRISPKADVSDSQIREIVAASFLSEIFYGIPADFMLLISAYETNFAMEYWHGGVGTTQQTIRAANTVLQSDFWIDRVYQSSGVKIRYQIVPISALDNVFLCITEAAKTIAIKTAELRIKTHQISPLKSVQFAGQSLPITWATAYKYNGSKKYAKTYAGGIHYYYKTKKWWLRSFIDNRYDLYAFKS